MHYGVYKFTWREMTIRSIICYRLSSVYYYMEA